MLGKRLVFSSIPKRQLPGGDFATCVLPLLLNGCVPQEFMLLRGFFWDDADVL
jgi:hypothetical protein